MKHYYAIRGDFSATSKEEIAKHGAERIAWFSSRKARDEWCAQRYDRWPATVLDLYRFGFKDADIKTARAWAQTETD